MKNLRKMVMLILTLAMLTTGVQVSVLADQTTDLQSMKVYAVNAAGKKTKAELNFSSTTYTYDITVMSDTESIEIVASPATSGSTWAIEKDGINTKMDFGKNYTAVVVTSSTGAKNKYEIKYTYSKFHCRKKAEKAPDTAQKRRFDPPVAKCRKKVYNNKKQT